MKKWIIYIILVLLMFQIAFAMEECMREQISKDIPCFLVTTWTPTNNCNTYSAKIFNESGILLDIHTFGSIGDSGRCNITFNHTELGQYYINSSIETWNVTITKENNMLAIIISIGILIAFFIALAILNENLPLKFISFGIAVIQVILMLGLVYAYESNLNYINLLRINFYSTLIIGFGMAMITLILRSMKMINPSKDKKFYNKWQEE
jgi:hypothetical protein